MIKTPYYLYDTALFKKTIDTAKKESALLDNAQIHFAVKSNNNRTLLTIIANAGLGADCVSGPEINRCIECGIAPENIVFAGVGKTDDEILTALRANIGCFNVESVPELDVINQLAISEGKIANVAFRINPNVDAHTHGYITTGLEENKFGISMDDMIGVIRRAMEMKGVRYHGLHFHIGSQILDMDCFRVLSRRINELQEQLDAAGIPIAPSINVGGGLGIDYDNPEQNPIPDFRNYFRAFAETLNLRPNQQVHFELGRAISGQCGRLITKCVFVKQTASKRFAILDAGMSDLIRPALYQAHHKIINLTAMEAGGRQTFTYDVVGPICESSDVFCTDVELPEVKRGDTLALLSAGAYGFVMASNYNLRSLPKEVID